MNLNLTVNESCATTATAEPRTKQVKVFYQGAAEVGQVSGPFMETEVAAIMTALLSRPDVVRAEVEDAQ